MKRIIIAVFILTIVITMNISSGNSTVQQKSSLIIGVGFKCDFNTIQSAIDFARVYAPRKVTLLLKDSQYEEALQLVGNTNISMIGENQTVIINKTGDYYTPPMNYSGEGYFENITFINNHDTSATYTIPGYALHCDSPGAGTTKFKNCTFISKQNSSVGIGMQQDQTLIFENCEFYKQDTGSPYNGGSLYCHNDQFSNVINQHLIIKNCYISSDLGLAMKIDDANTCTGGTDSPMDISFQNNILY